MSRERESWVDEETFHEDVTFLESLWRWMDVGTVKVPVIDIGEGEPLVFVPILEHLEFVYARQMRVLSKQRRVILYRRQETRRRTCTMVERVEELRQVLDGLGLGVVDLLGHGDAAMVLFEFALRYPQRCRSLTIVAQGADYRIAPHPFIWLLHELYLHLPVESVLSAKLLRRTVINYITACAPDNHASPALPRHLIEGQFEKIAGWPSVYKFSVLPVIHNFDISKRLEGLKMPILLLNRSDDRLAPEAKTSWLARHLPYCAGYHVIAGRERFFLYSRAEVVTPLIESFLQANARGSGTLG